MSWEGESRSRAVVERQDVEEIFLWLKTQPHLPQDIPDDLVRSFLHSTYLNIDRTKRTIETYFTCKAKSPEFFQDRNLDAPGMTHILNVIELCIVPKRTHRGWVVLVARLKDTDAAQFVIEHAGKLLFMAVDAMLRSDPTPKGVVFVFDNRGVTFRHLTRLSIPVVRKYFVYIQEAIPVRMKAVHVVNVNAVVAHVMNLIKPFLHKEHAKQIILHGPEDTKDMYEMVPQELLPEEYGGKQPPFHILAEETIRNIRKEAQWFREDETKRPDESKRVKTEEPSILGSLFKKLSFE